MYFACKSWIGGYGHNHLDQGSVIVAAYGEWFLFDKGVGGDMSTRWADPKVNNYFEAPIGHNTLVVGDGIYEDLGVWPDNPKYFAKPGKILDYRESDNGRTITFAADASGLFATEPVELFRRYVCVRIDPDGTSDNSIFIVDDIRLSEPRKTSGERGGLLLSYASSEPFSAPVVEFQDTGMADRNTYAMMLGAGMEVTDWAAGYQIELCVKPGRARVANEVASTASGFAFNTGGDEVTWDMETKSWIFKNPLE
jgi:hypothetical protein